VTKQKERKKRLEKKKGEMRVDGLVAEGKRAFFFFCLTIDPKGLQNLKGGAQGDERKQNHGLREKRRKYCQLPKGVTSTGWEGSEQGIEGWTAKKKKKKKKPKTKFSWKVEVGVG